MAIRKVALSDENYTNPGEMSTDFILTEEVGVTRDGREDLLAELVNNLRASCFTIWNVLLYNRVIYGSSILGKEGLS